MRRLDGGLELEGADLAEASRVVEELRGAQDARAVPSRDVLIEERDETAIRVEASRVARAAERHEREEALRLGILGEEIMGESEEESAEETEADGDGAEESDNSGVLGGAPPAEYPEDAPGMDTEGEAEGTTEDVGVGAAEVGEGLGGAAA